MTIEEQLKQEILSKYKSVRAFTTAINIPYSTLDSVFKRGIQNAGVSTMIKVFDALDLDIECIPGGTLLRRPLKSENSSSSDGSEPEEEISRLFDKLNDLLVSASLIRDGEDVTDEQADILLGVCRILNAAFKKRP